MTETFEKLCPRLGTPVLLTLRSILPTRFERAKIRVYWPKGRIALGPSTNDTRPVLGLEVTAGIVRAIELELLRRFEEKEHFQVGVIDEQLKHVTVPFNERTASSAAVSISRGSSIPFELKKKVRLFLHWCEPKGNAGATDLDLSVAFYDSDWRYVGVCSYYQLQCLDRDRRVAAQSSGDLRDAPWPDGASEFVDLDADLTAAMGVRFAVMVINAYAGLPFSKLEQGFAGIMLRDDSFGKHFDPRTVKLKFALDGANGVFMPLAIDLKAGVIHWLDVQSKGMFEMNNVESSKNAIATLCPNLIAYFASGVRPSIYELAMLHAAARCERVSVRGDAVKHFARRQDESTLHFFHRLISENAGDDALPYVDFNAPILGALYQGDQEVHEGSCCYCLFCERTVPTVTASDWLS